MKVLILKPSSLGDVIQALPVLRLLKRHLPQSKIYWWIETTLAPLLEGDPDLTDIIRFDRRGWNRPPAWSRLWNSLRWTRRQHFDLVIDLQCLARSGAFAWLANGNLTVGLDEPREGARGFYDLIVPRGSFHTHAVEWYLSVLPLLKVPVDWNFEWLPARPGAEADVRSKWPVADRRWILFQPGARWANKRWPAESFAELLRLLAAQYADRRFAVLGGPEDRPLGATITSAAPDRCLDLTGQLTLPEMIEWIRLSDFMVTNDTGPMHVAAAVGTPTLALFGPTEPARTGPFRQIQNVLQLNLPCVTCLKTRCRYPNPLECMRALRTEAAFSAAKNLAESSVA